jgi:hypothetical protein
VLWEIDLDADSPREAAELALTIHRDPDSIATCFTVIASDGTVTHHDLSEDGTPPPDSTLTPAQQAAPIMLAALQRVAENYACGDMEDCGIINADTFSDVERALRAAGVAVGPEA